MKRLILGFIAFCFLLSSVAVSEGAKAVITKGKKVKFDYTLTVQGKVMDTSEGKDPLEYTQGAGMIIPGLERQLEGLKVGDERTIKVLAKEAYGELDPNAIREMPRTFFPADVTLQQGMMVPLQAKDGQKIVAIIQNINKDTVVLNFNHPLAGQELQFDVKIVDIK
ncbi:MAG: peptidylprolyl isomerase [Candidatus Omnitrophota bacterium]